MQNRKYAVEWFHRPTGKSGLKTFYATDNFGHLVNSWSGGDWWYRISAVDSWIGDLPADAIVVSVNSAVWKQEVVFYKHID